MQARYASVSDNITDRKLTCMFSIQYIKIDKAHQGQRVDNFLITHCKKTPRSRLYRAIRRGEVRVNKKRIKPEYRLQLHDFVRIPPFKFDSKTIFTKKTIDRYKFLLNLIEYEDNEFILLNKPSGIPVHGGSFVNLGIIEALTQLRPKLRYLRLVHRLDRETSGCLLLAKKRSALVAVQELMLRHKIKKQYLVLVKGSFPKRQQVVNLPLKKNHLAGGERIVTIDRSGKFAQTIFIPKQYLSNATLLKATIVTGRTHQIRVHAKAVGYSVAGDEKYGDRDFNQTMKTMGLRRLFLHAASLTFKINDKTFRFKAMLPEPLRKLIDKIK